MEEETPLPNQSLSPIPIHVGSALIRPEDKGKITSVAVEAMSHYANQEIDLLRQQAELIMKQVREIEERVGVSHQIYQAEMRFTPKIMGVYHLYEKNDGVKLLSLVGPNEWGRSFPYKNHVAKVKLLGDHTWEVISS
ncbi:MAG: DUF2452 domain-containing protein [Bacteroidota bacterium]|nr:DUF2452 domain-containing protein [Bacteroidota bacterium]